MADGGGAGGSVCSDCSSLCFILLAFSLYEGDQCLLHYLLPLWETLARCFLDLAHIDKDNYTDGRLSTILLAFQSTVQTRFTWTLFPIKD